MVKNSLFTVCKDTPNLLYMFCYSLLFIEHDDVAEVGTKEIFDTTDDIPEGGFPNFRNYS